MRSSFGAMNQSGRMDETFRLSEEREGVSSSNDDSGQVMWGYSPNFMMNRQHSVPATNSRDGSEDIGQFRITNEVDQESRKALRDKIQELRDLRQANKTFSPIEVTHLIEILKNRSDLQPADNDKNGKEITP